MAVPHGFCLLDPAHRGFRCVGTVGGSLGPVHCCVQGFPWGALSACGGRGLEESLSASRGVLRVYFWGVGLGCHEDPLCPVEYPPLGVRLEDVGGGLLGGCVEGVPWGDGNLRSGGLEVWGGHAAEELMDVEGREWVVGALWWRQHCWDGGGVLVVFLGGEGVECGGDDVLCLSLLDYVSLCAEIFG